jgi:hypothetical protein
VYPVSNMIGGRLFQRNVLGFFCNLVSDWRDSPGSKCNLSFDWQDSAGFIKRSFKIKLWVELSFP